MTVSQKHMRPLCHVKATFIIHSVPWARCDSSLVLVRGHSGEDVWTSLHVQARHAEMRKCRHNEPRLYKRHRHLCEEHRALCDKHTLRSLTIWTLSGHYLDTFWTSDRPCNFYTRTSSPERIKEIKANARESKIASGALPWPKIGTTLFPSAWSRPRRLTCRQPHGSQQRPRWGRQPGPL